MALAGAPAVASAQGSTLDGQWMSFAVKSNSLTCNYIRANWTCTPGYYCQSPSDNGNATIAPLAKNKCPPGFFCPVNTCQPAYCCPGFFCPTPADIKICPPGFWCPFGTVAPLSCSFLAYCPEGSSSAIRFGVVFLLLGTFAFSMVLFQLCKLSGVKRNRKYTKRLRTMDDKTTPPAAELLEDGYWMDEFFDTADDVNNAVPHLNCTKNSLRLDIEFENLGLTLATGVEIMKGVSGALKAGRLCAVMGPSGAGKSTFFSLLTGKAKRTSGTVRINGEQGELSVYRKLIGFAPQDDAMLRDLTVLDILMHSALMRLPTEWTEARKKDLVLSTIAYLGLESIMNSIIGDETKRGISGGQRKRVNIGIELVSAPVFLMLDEPTSGLDSATSLEVCKLLRTIARDQCMTIAAIVHSPSPSAFDQFDDLLLLGRGGRTVYMGPRAEAAEYFGSIGFRCWKGASLADFYMDIITGRVRCTRAADFEPEMLFTCWELAVAGKDPALGLVNKNLQPSHRKSVIQRIAPRSSFLASLASRVITIKEYWEDVATELWAALGTLRKPDPVRSTPNAFATFRLCYARACTQIYQSPKRFWVDQLTHVICGLFLSVASVSNDYNGLLPSSVCALAPPLLGQGLGCSVPLDQLSLSGLFITLGPLFAGVMVGASTFGLERVVYWRDTSAGMPLLPFFLAKWAADFPRMITSSIMFTLSLALLLPYHSSLVDIGILISALYFCAFSMGYFLSTVVQPRAVHLASTGFVLLWCMLLGGVAPDFADVQSNSQYAPFRWLWSISAPRWAIEAYYVKETSARPWAELHDNAMPLRHAYHASNFGHAVVNIMGIGLAWALLSVVALKLTNRERQK
ncbi:hypothetical protein BDZ88DRAFT_429014 [Geranomyces variabilis]|nr:hypothetical protein BDZ88DRAFT_429014 [Geranomyces variabilis]KAJ3138548.1 hypothetical protein HDU90_000989 [Geranomyces variabilis]